MERFSRRVLIRNIPRYAAGLAAAALVGCGDERPEQPLPEGFSRKTSDYKYQIIIDVGSGQSVRAYSNEKPHLQTEGGLALLRATNIYCPDEYPNKQFSGDIGCWNQVIPLFELASPKRIVVKSTGK